MANISYVALRALAPSHSIGNAYSFLISPMEMSPRAKPVSDESVSLGGYSQTYVHRIDRLWSFKTKTLTEGTSEYENILEFLESTLGYENFQIDINDSASYENARMQSPYSRKREGSTNEWTFNFTVRILP